MRKRFQFDLSTGVAWAAALFALTMLVTRANAVNCTFCNSVAQCTGGDNCTITKGMVTTGCCDAGTSDCCQCTRTQYTCNPPCTGSGYYRTLCAAWNHMPGTTARCDNNVDPPSCGLF